MKRKNLFNLLIVLGIALALTCGVVIASRVQAQEAGPLAPQSAVDTSFTYQGRLIQSGGPVSDTCDFRFNLYDDASPFPSLVVGPVEQTNVPVSDGYFSTSIDFGADAFTGEGRQLEILTRCPAGSGSYTTLSPMVWVNPAPYAHSLRPGAVISGDVSTGLLVRTVAGGTAQALLAHASSSTGQTSGVWGATKSEEGGVGVVGRAEASSGKAYGIFGISFSPGGTGVYGTAPTTGTVGVATGSSGVTYGVYGKANSNGWALYADGRAYVDDDLYVNGDLDSDGDFHALSNAEVDGDVTVHGDLTWEAKTSYLSIPAAALQPNDESITWDISTQGDHFFSTSNTYYVAPVFLPHGATVTEIKTWWEDQSGNDASLELRRADPFSTSAYTTMVTLETLGTGQFVSSETTITDPVIDNSQYSYILYVELPDSDIDYYQTVIEYTITEPY
jgi:hypothetical protein